MNPNKIIDVIHLLNNQHVFKLHLSKSIFMLAHWLFKFWHQFHKDQFTNLAAVCAASNSAGSQLV